MKKAEEICQLKAKISDNADKIKYLLNHVLDGVENDRENFLVITMAIDFAITIKYLSEDIEKVLMN